MYSSNRCVLTFVKTSYLFHRSCYGRLDWLPSYVILLDVCCRGDERSTFTSLAEKTWSRLTDCQGDYVDELLILCIDDDKFSMKAFRTATMELHT